MGLPLRMDNIHAPTIPSGPSSRPLANGNAANLSFAELSQKKCNLEDELKALGGVLDSVSLPIQRISNVLLTNYAAWSYYGDTSYNARWVPTSRY